MTTITEEVGIFPPEHEPLHFSDAVHPPTLHQSAGLFPPHLPGIETPDVRRFGVADIHEALGLLDLTRTNGRYPTPDLEGGGFHCRYSRRNRETGDLSALALPDCFIGAILALMVPTYYQHVARDSTLGIGSLPGIAQLFSPNAVTLLRETQRFADGAYTAGNALPWREAWDRAAVLVLDATTALF
jgi:hypothetical protein